MAARARARATGRRPGGQRRRAWVVPIVIAALAALAATAPSLAHLSRALVPGGGDRCWVLHTTRELADPGLPVTSVGRRCAPTRFGLWSWRGTSTGPQGVTSYRWNETVRPDGRPRRLHFLSLDGPAIARLDKELPGAAGLVLGHLDLITVRLTGGSLRYELHGDLRVPVPFRPVSR